MDFCCTCTTTLTPDTFSSSADDKPKIKPDNRTLRCCGRIICGQCLQKNERFASYCPYCQISSAPTSLPQSLKEPLLYTSIPPTHSTTAVESSDVPPPYTHKADARQPNKPNNAGDGDINDEKAALAEDEKQVADDILHFLNHEHDTIASLSLRYRVPADALRRANNITSDHLLQGRRSILVPGEYYKGGVSLSPRPVEGEDEELRKAKIRRFMTICKVSDYDIALLYLEQSNYDLDKAVEQYFGDEAWERENPLGSTSAADAGSKRRYKTRVLVR